MRWKSVVCSLSLLLALYVPAAGQFLSLSGDWEYRPDPDNKGMQERWFSQRFGNRLQLPGTLDDAGYGDAVVPPTEKDTLLHLTRKHRYVGAAWYRREITVPPGYTELLLERVIWHTTVWVDGKMMGTAESLSTPHRFTGLKPGKHVVVLRIDNSMRYDISHKLMAHAYTDETQIIWNGVIGRIGLQKPAPQVQIYPEPDKKRIRVTLTAPASLRLKKGNAVIASKAVSAGESFLPLGSEVVYWDEFNPALYTLEVNGTAVQFGVRELSNKNGLLYLNGRRIFLRGTLDCNISPLTGHPPMTRQEWVKEFAVVRNYGLNHVRFHSWCPPEAAFQAADSMGIYLQVELPLWALNVGEDTAALRFLTEEAQRIIASYGNHPSFCLWSMGNELQGDFSWLQRLTTSLKQQDNRRLYATTTFTFQKGYGGWPLREDDFFVTQWTNKGWVRGQGIFNTKAPGFRLDYSAPIDSMPVPVISHEIGQYSVFPDMREIAKYTGVLEPLNMKLVRNQLEQRKLLQQAADFTQASGKLAVLLYKEEIERALKTPGFSGFQLLDLHDFPGQGTALVGLLNAFWESKGLVTPEAFRQFCGPVVPLLRFEKATYANNEIFEAKAEVANFSTQTFTAGQLRWEITGDGKRLAAGQGHIRYDLSAITTATALDVRLYVDGTSYTNHWTIWVYPAKTDLLAPGIVFTQSTDSALAALAAGKTVLLNPDTAAIRGIPGRFTSVFWSPVHFPNQPGSMGLLLDPKHPALAAFPTEFHTNWQWWDLVTHSKSIEYDALPKWQPVVQVIDNFVKNRRLGILFEARVGKGKLVLCTADISRQLDQRITARQLRYSLQQYMHSPAFNPAVTITAKELKSLL
ncbi:glycoside hydrolase family 2 [Chitinophaga lutea]|uniref:beta-galactosidase n=1 Tax=Chitinophaga lutea TaxID=2488634 RepID=A0A3N4PIJ3_9BACT|nr:glycoside hydrolase family 2 TIM barrel-domain containing protein [Chitinophaga lutea]RPE08036.1 glycoside hydrolase family 2 [Chitinophaga lutea]